MIDSGLDFISSGIEQNFDIQGFLVKNKPATYFFRVGSDAMANAGIAAGDRLVVDRSIKPNNRDIVVAVHQGQFVVRRILILKNSIELFAENPQYPAITFINAKEVDIWGVVVGLARKY